VAAAAAAAASEARVPRGANTSAVAARLAPFTAAAAKISLIATYNTRMPGYGGHRPVQSADFSFKAPTDSEALPESLRASAPVASYWAAVAAARARESTDAAAAASSGARV